MSHFALQTRGSGGAANTLKTMLELTIPSSRMLHLMQISISTNATAAGDMRVVVQRFGTTGTGTNIFTKIEPMDRMGEPTSMVIVAKDTLTVEPTGGDADPSLNINGSQLGGILWVPPMKEMQHMSNDGDVLAIMVAALTGSLIINVGLIWDE